VDDGGSATLTAVGVPGTYFHHWDCGSLGLSESLSASAAMTLGGIHENISCTATFYYELQ
jgi:hypothetical protein